MSRWIKQTQDIKLVKGKVLDILGWNIIVFTALLHRQIRNSPIPLLHLPDGMGCCFLLLSYSKWARSNRAGKE